VDLPDRQGAKEKQTFLSMWVFDGAVGSSPDGPQLARSRAAEPVDVRITREVRASGLGNYIIHRITNRAPDPIVLNWRQPYSQEQPLYGDIEGAIYGSDSATGSLALQPGEIQWLWFSVGGSETTLSLSSIEITDASGTYVDYFDSTQSVTLAGLLPILASFEVPETVDAGGEFSGTVEIRSTGTIPGGLVVRLERRVPDGEWAMVSEMGVDVPDFGSDTFAVADLIVPQNEPEILYRASILYGAETVFEQVRTVSLTADADEDGMDDFWESENGLNATVDDSGGDPDNDGLVNLDEYKEGTDPQVADTDGDGLNDGPEVHTYLTSPLVRDSDFGGVPDGAEILASLNPLDASDDPVSLEITLPTTVIDEQDRVFLTWVPSRDDEVTEYRVKVASTVEGLASAVPQVTGGRFLQLTGLDLTGSPSYQVEVAAYAGDVLISAQTVELLVGKMPSLTFERFAGALISVSATGEDGDFDILYSDDLQSWENVGSLSMAGGNGFSSFKLDKAGGRGFFRLEGDNVAGAMPVLMLDPPERADFCLTAEGLDGSYDLMFSPDLKEWERIDTLRVSGGAGFSLIEKEQSQKGFFRLEHRY